MKLITKILDNYYTEKLEDFIKQIEISWYLDFKHINTKDELLVLVKKKKYNDKLFREIMHFQKKDSFTYLCDKEKLAKNIDRLIKEYSGDESDER